MDRISHQELNQILGIYPPFKITDVSFEKENQNILIKLINLESPKNSFFNRGQSDVPICIWQHFRIGRFDTFIQISLCDKTNAKIHSNNPPSFLGHPTRKYTNQLQQTILFGLNKGVEPSVLSTLFGIDLVFINEIKDKFNQSEGSNEVIHNLPPNTHPIWSSLIKDEIQIKTNFTPLNMLITRLQVSYFNDPNNLSEHQKSCDLLFSFFEKQKFRLSSELNQLGITSSSSKKYSGNKHKNIVLKIDHPLWHQLLTGKMSIASRHVGLNLKIPALRNQYAIGSPDERSLLIRELIDFLKKNRPSLEVELDAIRKIAISMLDKNSTECHIPPEDHIVWHDIISGELRIESTYIPFNLFLAGLKIRPGKRANGLLHGFVLKNSSIMINEIEAINKYSKKNITEAVTHA